MHDGAVPYIFKNAAKLRIKMTEAELLLWDFFRTKPLGLKIRRQHPINCYVLDFYCHKLRLAIEIDGGYHLRREQRLKDRERTEYLKSISIRVIRFTNEQVLAETDKVKQQILYELEGAPEGKIDAPPAPNPQS